MARKADGGPVTQTNWYNYAGEEYLVIHEGLTYLTNKPANWRDDLTEQELELINTALVYAANNLKGMGGHHMAMLCAKLVAKLDARTIPPVLEVRADAAEQVRKALDEYFKEKKDDTQTGE